MDTLLGITIGPVQSYIQDSKKTIDLKNSSRIISNMVKNIISRLKEKDAKVIYPYYENKARENDVTNYIICRVDDNVTIDMEKIIDATYNEVIQNMKLIAYEKDIYQRIEKCKQEIDKQIRDVFRITWARVNIKNNYEEAYIQLTKLLSDLKNTFVFEQLVESGKKCSICGKRKVMFNDYEDKLCAACFYKRKYSKIKDDNSTYYFSCINWYEKFIDECELLQDIEKDIIEVFKYKYKYFYSSSFDKIINCIKNKKMDYLEQELKPEILENDEEVNIANITKTKEKLLRCYKKIGQPYKNFGLIQMDVDNLGKWLRGYYRKNNEELGQYQIDLSKLLYDFSQEVKQSLVKLNTQIVYLGGDDILVFSPYESIIDAYEIIRNAFDKNVCSDERFSKMGFSTSIVTARYNLPLSYVIITTNEGLAKVKSRFEKSSSLDYIEKNGLYVRYIVNANKNIEGYLKKEDVEIIQELLIKFRNWKLDESFSNSFINAFTEEFKLFNNGFDYDGKNNIIEIYYQEIKRLLLRSSRDMTDDELLAQIGKLLDAQIKENRANNWNVDKTNFINLLTIIDRLSEVYKGVEYVSKN